MKRVLLFRTEGICHGTLQVCNEKIAECMRNEGIQCDILECRRPRNEVLCELEKMLSGGYDAAIAFNQTDLSDIVLQSGECIFDHYHVPFYNYIVDSPWGYTLYTETRCKNYHLICVDLDHVEQVKRYCPDIKSVHFLPLGGISSKEACIPFENRSIDLLYYAGHEKMTLKEMLEHFKGLPDPYPVLLLNMIDHMMAYREKNEEEALRNVLRDVFHVENIDTGEFRKILVATTEAGLFMRTFIREEVVRTLVKSRIRLHLFGEGWEQRVGSGSGCTVFREGFPYSELSGYLGRARIILNVFPWFKNGTNERIASGALHRTAVLTDHSKYTDTFPQGLLYQYSINNVSELPDQIESILSNPQNTYQTIEKTYEYANRYMTWESTVKDLIELIGDR